jgi:hypothetical protein
VSISDRERLFELLGRADAECAAYAQQQERWAALLRGEAVLFGKRAQIVWPDGSPYGRSNEELAEWVSPAQLTTPVSGPSDV